MGIYILISLIAFAIGAAASWLLKSNLSDSGVEWKVKLSAEEDLHRQTAERLSAADNQVSEFRKQLHQAQLDTAVLTSKYENESSLTNQLKLESTEQTAELDKLREKVNEALQEKTKAQSSLLNANETIKDFQKKEQDLKLEFENSQKLLTSVREENAGLTARHEEAVKRLQEQQNFIEQANEKLKDTFSSLSAQALKNNNESFVTLAKTTLEKQVTEAKGDFDKKQQAIDAIVKPLSESLGKFDTKIQDMEKIRLEQHGQLNQYIQGVQHTTEGLLKETHNLVTALKTSHGRGKYGEIALRRVVEVAGMTEHCDFKEQVSVNSHEGLLRPDMIIRLPERKSIVVDSKVPLAAYMKAFETDSEEEKKILFLQHAAAVREHLKKLSHKAYWSQFSESPDYVVLYMQIESSFGAALQADPTLIELAIKDNIILATPTTLITLLRTVGFVWQQVSVTENIEEIRDAGIELYNRTTVLLKHFSQIGGSLKSVVSNYNNAVSSLESRFVPQAKKIYTLGSSYTKNTLPIIEPIELNVRDSGIVKEEEEIPETKDDVVIISEETK